MPRTPASCAARTRPPVAAAPLSRPRRLTLVMRHLLCVLSSVMSRSPGSGANGRVDALITAAAAEIAGHGFADFRIGRRGFLGEKGRRLHDLPGLAVAALRHAIVTPGNLHRMLALGMQAFDG